MFLNINKKRIKEICSLLSDKKLKNEPLFILFINNTLLEEKRN